MKEVWFCDWSCEFLYVKNYWVFFFIYICIYKLNKWMYFEINFKCFLYDKFKIKLSVYYLICVGVCDRK